jgi:hypothetical protein
MKNEKLIERIAKLEACFQAEIGELKKCLLSDKEEKGNDKLNRPLTEWMFSFEDACLVTGDDPETVIANAGKSTDNIAYEKLKVCVKALCKGQGENGADYIADYKNKKQRKYFPVHEEQSGWFVFVVSNFGATMRVRIRWAGSSLPFQMRNCPISQEILFSRCTKKC